MSEVVKSDKKGFETLVRIAYNCMNFRVFYDTFNLTSANDTRLAFQKKVFKRNFKRFVSDLFDLNCVHCVGCLILIGQK